MTLFATIAERKELSEALRDCLTEIEDAVFVVTNEEVGTLAETNTDLYDLERKLLAQAAVFAYHLAAYRLERPRLQADQLAQIAEAQSDHRELTEGPMQHERL